MRKAHQEYINNLFDFQTEDNIDNASNNVKAACIIKRLWQYVKAKHKDSIGIPILKSNGVDIADPKLKAQVLNTQYNRVFTNENPILPTIGQSEFPDMPDIAIDHIGVRKLLEKINPSKATLALISSLRTY